MFGPGGYILRQGSEGDWWNQVGRPSPPACTVPVTPAEMERKQACLESCRAGVNFCGQPLGGEGRATQAEFILCDPLTIPSGRCGSTSESMCNERILSISQEVTEEKIVFSILSGPEMACNGQLLLFRLESINFLLFI